MFNLILNDENLNIKVKIKLFLILQNLKHNVVKVCGHKLRLWSKLMFRLILTLCRGFIATMFIIFFELSLRLRSRFQ